MGTIHATFQMLQEWELETLRYWQLLLPARNIRDHFALFSEWIHYLTVAVILLIAAQQN